MAQNRLRPVLSLGATNSKPSLLLWVTLVTRGERLTTKQTQERILSAISQMFGDLDIWIKGLGLSEDQVVAIYSVVLEENGMAAQLVANLTAQVFPLSSKFQIDPKQAVAWFRRGKSE